MTTKEILNWQDDAQDKKVPSEQHRTRLLEESNGATSPSAPCTNGVIPPSQHPSVGQDSLATPTPPPATRPNLRNYKKVYWSVEEKKQILYCHAFSRQGWGKGKDQVFKEQLGLSELNKEKLQKTNVKNLCSLVSQIDKYIPTHECEAIKEQGRKRAQEAFALLDPAVRKQLDKSNWSQKEKWTIIWAMEFSKSKYKNQKERCAE